MCFILFIGSREPVQLVPFDEKQRTLWTEALKEHYQPVRKHFSLPHVTYVGSSLNCGCGFRHAMYQNGDWPEEWWATQPESDFDPAETQADHEAMKTFIQRNCSDGSAELYGYWEGNIREPAVTSLKVSLDDITAPLFHFRERVLYKVSLKGQR